MCYVMVMFVVECPLGISDPEVVIQFGVCLHVFVKCILCDY